MKLHLYDATPAEPGKGHGPLGPTHCGDITFDSEFETADSWVRLIEQDHPWVVRVDCPAEGREWTRAEGQGFVEVTPPLTEEPPPAGEAIRVCFYSRRGLCSWQDIRSGEPSQVNDVVRTTGLKHPEVVRAECRTLRRGWKREGRELVEAGAPTSLQLNCYLGMRLYCKVYVGTVDSAEDEVRQVETYSPRVTLVECPDLNRAWARAEDGRLVEVKQV